MRTWIIALQECRTHLRGYKPACSVLGFVLLYGIAGYTAGLNYSHQLSAHAESVSAHRQSLAKYRSLSWLDSGGLYLDRAPAPLSTMVRGLEGSFGSVVRISKWIYPNFSGGMSDSPLVSAFMPVDFLFIVKVVASLYALLLSFDRIVGERDAKTMRLLLSTSVSRRDVYVGKAFGALVGAAVPLSVGWFFGVMAILIGSDIMLTAHDLGRTGVLWFLSLLYVAGFIALGLAVSTLSKSSLSSLTTCIVAWIAIVIVSPSILVAAASIVAPQPSVVTADAEIEVIKQAGSLAVLYELRDKVEKTRKDVSIPEVFMANLHEAERRLPLVRQIRIDHDLEQRRFDRAALVLTSLSPAGALTHLSTRVAETGLRDFRDYLDDAHQYRSEVVVHYDAYSDRKTPFDIDAVPPFIARPQTMVRAMTESWPELAVLSLWPMLWTIVGLFAFRSYDAS